MVPDASRAATVPPAEPVDGAPVDGTTGAAIDSVAGLAERLGRDQVFGPPVQSGDTTLVPVARVRGGGGLAGAGGGAGTRSGAGLEARAIGAFAVGPNGVSWHPAVDVNRIVLGGQLALAAVLLGVLLRRRRR